MNQKKLRRLYKEEGLSVKRKRGRKRATGTREPMPVPDGPSQRWSFDFVSDVFGPARRFRMLNVIDDYTRECPYLSFASLTSRRKHLIESVRRSLSFLQSPDVFRLTQTKVCHPQSPIRTARFFLSTNNRKEDQCCSQNLKKPLQTAGCPGSSNSHSSTGNQLPLNLPRSSAIRETQPSCNGCAALPRSRSGTFQQSPTSSVTTSPMCSLPGSLRNARMTLRSCLSQTG